MRQGLRRPPLAVVPVMLGSLLLGAGMALAQSGPDNDPDGLQGYVDKREWGQVYIIHYDFWGEIEVNG